MRRTRNKGGLSRCQFAPMNILRQLLQICCILKHFNVLFKNITNFAMRALNMKSTLTQKQIGQRLMDLRKLKGLSQEDLAKLVNISRPSLTQIELGNRSVDVQELQKFARILEFSLDDFVSKDFALRE